MRRTGPVAVSLGMLIALPMAAHAAPAEAPCVYLGLGCDAPPLPAPNFPDALVPPIAVPVALGPALGAPPVAAPPPPDFDPEPSAIVHHRRRHDHMHHPASPNG